MRGRLADALDEPLVRAVALVIAALIAIAAYQIAFTGVEGALVPGSPASAVDGAPGSAVASSDGLLNDSVRNDLNTTRVEGLIVLFVNQARERHGVDPYSRDPELATVARAHSRDMAEQRYLGHRDEEGSGPTARANAMGYRCIKPVHFGIGENVARTYYRRGTRTNAGEYVFYANERELARGVVRQWLRSEGHRRAMLADFFSEVGTGVEVTHDGTVYVTQSFC